MNLLTNCWLIVVVKFGYMLENLSIQQVLVRISVHGRPQELFPWIECDWRAVTILLVQAISRKDRLGCLL